VKGGLVGFAKKFDEVAQVWPTPKVVERGQTKQQVADGDLTKRASASYVTQQGYTELQQNLSG
jgi:hypothetical protein